MLNRAGRRLIKSVPGVLWAPRLRPEAFRPPKRAANGLIRGQPADKLLRKESPKTITGMSWDAFILLPPWKNGTEVTPFYKQGKGLQIQLVFDAIKKKNSNYPLQIHKRGVHKSKPNQGVSVVF